MKSNKYGLHMRKAIEGALSTEQCVPAAQLFVFSELSPVPKTQTLNSLASTLNIDHAQVYIYIYITGIDKTVHGEKERT